MDNQEFESILEAYPVRLENFEGPLDLLLHLIKRHEVNIYDIPITLITAQYLEYIDLMKELNLDVAGEFLVMAATLIHIKSRMLIPRPTPDAEGELDEEDPREALVRRLLEHQKFKAAAELLHEREIQRSAGWGRPDERVARIFFLALYAGRCFRPWQQHLRLDVDERRRHHQELARDVEVELLHQLNRLEVLRRDQRNRNVVDVDLVLLDQMKEEVNRTLEVLEPDRQGIGGRFEVVRCRLHPSFLNS